MSSLVYLLVIVGVLAIVMLILALRSGGREGSQIERRLERYVEGGERQELSEQEIEEEARRLSRLTEGLNKVIEKRNFATNISNRLAQASIKLTVAEYLILSACSIILGGALAFLVFRNFLFVAGLIGGFFFPRIVVGVMKGQRLKKFNDQLGDTINLLVNSLRSGYSMPQAMETVAKDMPPPIAEEFRRVVIEIGLGVPLETALNNMLRRVDSPDLDLMITAINVQHEVGGNLAEILDIISYTIRERVRIQGEIKTLTAQGEITGYVISGLPFALTGILFLLNREYMLRMFTTPCGWIMSGIAVTIIVLGFLAMRKVVQIEV
jgi:tight adherence protein B